ncbi:hypothetical protein SK128_007330 [Halocaridina rubra]|uniref:Innexin n=1 Tax=Halocaridina rubra TaxID=373956 RepID=A0AAN8X737_HALRR
MVVGVLAALAGLVKVRYSYTAVDSQVFRLHYRWTTAICFICCALVVAKEYVGDPIECINGDPTYIKQITSYCWISSTYTINSTDDHMPFVGPYRKDLHEKRYHSYYLWVPVVLFIQGCIFYFPHLIWKSYEGKQLDLLLQDLNKGLFDEDAEKKKKNIVSYLKESWGLNTHYVSVYYICEALNLCSVVAQMLIMNKFLGGLFMDYGIKVLSLINANDAERHDPLITTFPRLTKCDFMRYGPTGTVVTEDILCILPQNIVNEKIFLVMWIWFVFLTTVTSAWLLWRAVVLLNPSVRLRILEHLSKSKLTQKMKNTILSLHLGDYCLLESMGHNLDILNFTDILRGITDSVEEYSPLAPMETGTYKPFYTPNALTDTIPRYRNLGFADTSL